MEDHVGFKSAKAQFRCLKKLRDAGYTVRGWARARGFSEFTVNNILMREDGLAKDLGPKGSAIMAKLKEEGLAQ